MGDAELEEALLAEFLDEYGCDSEAGRVRSLEEYLAARPASIHPRIAQAYAELEHCRAALSVDGALPQSRRIGKYRLLRELGRGGQGQVYLARDDKLGREVALKVFRPHFFGSERERLRFQREAAIAAKLEHIDAICPIYETGEEQEEVYIAMRYVHGETLAAHLEAQPLPGRQEIPRAAELVEELARAVHAAHEAGILHRDIKARNVIVTPQGRPVLLDFGIARDTAEEAELTLSGDVLGTPAYMAPERWYGTAQQPYDRLMDVYSLGVVLYECLAHARPFHGATAAHIARLQERDAPSVRRANPAVSRDLETVVRTALERDRLHRYQSALELAEDLRRTRERRPVLARRPGPLLVASRFAERHALELLVSVVIAVLAAGGLWLWRGRDAAVAARNEIQDWAIAARLLDEEQEELWPVGPQLVPRCKEWLELALTLIDRWEDHRASLAELEHPTDGNARRTAAEAPRAERLRELLENVERLQIRAQVVRDRGQRSASLEKRSIVDFGDAWADCIQAVRASPRYGGLQLVPQLGLVPLGENEVGLWEFLDVESGERPQGKPDSGLVIGEDTGIVLVLLPGGRFRIGATGFVQGGMASPQQNEGPLQEVELAAFFFSKYELSQAQWKRIFEGDNPAFYKRGYILNNEQVVRDDTHPIEAVSFSYCERAALRLGLQLPTEAQWEYGCRANCEDPWFWGTTLENAKLYGNFRGEECNEIERDGFPITDFEDDYMRHAPVWSCSPNSFGLHHMLGNVFEWTRDPYLGRYPETFGAGDGSTSGGAESERAVRGGSFTTPVQQATSSLRGRWFADRPRNDLGMRPARAVQPAFGTRP